MTDVREVMISIVLKTEGLPNDLVEDILDEDIQYSYDEIISDSGYIDFLDHQIEVGARGPEWTNLLKARRQAFLQYLDKTLISGYLGQGDPYSEKRKFIFFFASPDDTKIIHWERYAEGKFLFGSPIERNEC